MKTRLVVLIALLISIMPAIPVSAASYPVPNLHFSNVEFVTCESDHFALSYDLHHEYTGNEGQLTLSWTYRFNSQIVQAGVADLRSPGVVYEDFWNTWGPFGPETASYTFDIRDTTRLNGIPVFETRVQGTCIYAGGTFEFGTLTVTNTVLTQTTTVQPGPDLIPIPESARGGRITADTLVYWSPRADAITDTILPAGTSVWALGPDTSGKFFKIAYAGQYLWVPSHLISSNPDSLWQNAPLPTTVVN